MQTVIVAGGKGLRLGIKDIPKPMVKIGDKPVLEYQINLAKKYNCEEVFIISGHLSHTIKNYFGKGENFGININHITEPFPLGTAGSLKLLENKLKKRFLVFYGDIFMNFNVQNFINFDNKNSHSIGTTLVHINNHPYDSDLLKVDENNRVTKILTKPHTNSISQNCFANSGIYIFSNKIFNFIEDNTPQDICKDILPRIINKNLFAYITNEYIKDMGTPDRLEKIKKEYEDIFGKNKK